MIPNPVYLETFKAFNANPVPMSFSELYTALETRTVDMTVANLRQKIEREPAEPRIVVTVKGVGYAWGDS